MIPWKTIDCTQLPKGGGELSLHKRGDEFAIRVDGYDLMNSLAHESEDVLAKLACRKIADRSKPSMLIGGLGMGFTLAAALKQLNSKADVVVAELVPAVVAWNRKHLAKLSGNSLDDKRVTVRELDVAEILKKESSAYDAILLDVDNGPEGMTVKGNDWLYSKNGLNASFKALRPRGVLAVWSVRPDEVFAKRLGKSGFDVEEVRVRSKGRHGSSRHTIWIAEKPA
ncbi:MAG: spermidine synthase [Deltaproteobacteria bacterium]|jgi:spermidine synthase|nr:spermidine synthase [Deltaproteobacteria bacterium]